MTKDNQQRFYLTLEVTEACRSGTKWTTFWKQQSVCHISSLWSKRPHCYKTSLSHLCISDLAIHSPDLWNALYFHIANITSVLGKHVAPPFSLTHVDFDNTAAAPKLTLALGKSVSHIQQIAGSEVCAELIKKFRRSVCHSPQLSVGFSHTDNRPFHRIKCDKKPEYHFGGTHFAQDTTLKFYCQLHFAKDLSEDMIKRIHAELMTHYFIWQALAFWQPVHTYEPHVSVPKVMLPKFKCLLGLLVSKP